MIDSALTVIDRRSEWSSNATSSNDYRSGRKSSAVVKDVNESGGKSSVKKEKMDLNPPKVRLLYSRLPLFFLFLIPCRCLQTVRRVLAIFSPRINVFVIGCLESGRILHIVMVLRNMMHQFWRAKIFTSARLAKKLHSSCTTSKIKGEDA